MSAFAFLFQNPFPSLRSWIFGGWVTSTPWLRCWTWVGVAAFLAVSTSQRVAAQSITLKQDDIVVEIDQVIEDCPDGGYFPLPIKVLNRGPSATIRFEAGVVNDIRHTVGKTITLSQNASSRFSLLIPMVSRSSQFRLSVAKDGRQLESIEYFWGNSYISHDSGSWLVIAESKPNLNDWTSWKRSRSVSVGYRTYEPLIAHIVPSSAFESWLAYTSLETVAIDAAAFSNKLSEAQRNELLRWVCAGGTLLVYNVNLLENKLGELDQAMNWESRAAVGPGWSIEPIETATESSRRPLDKEACENEPMLVRGLMLGRVVAARNDPFADVEYDSNGKIRSWSQYEQLLDQRLVNTTIRNGVNPRGFAGDFLKFVNPGIQIIPTWGFIVLITVFSLVIGPVNYFYLKRRNRIGNLLWTTPLLALVTTVGLLGWTSIANGTSSRLRMRSLTILDQRSQVAVSLTRAAMFSGRAPANGLRFEPYSAVYPVWPKSDAFRSGEVDWTDAQNLNGDFHSSNTRSQVFVVTPRTLRSRLRIEPAVNDLLNVSNGLEWELEKLLVCDHQGNIYVGARLKPGESQKLKRAGNEDIDQLSGMIASQSMLAPRVNVANRVEISNRYGPYGFEVETRESDFGSGYLERYLSWLQRDLKRGGMGLAPGTWLGIVAEHPDLDLGLTEFTITEQLHVMLGAYDE